MSIELPIEINMEVEESEMSFDMEIDSEINVTSVQGTDVTDTTAVEADVKSGKIFHKADGSRATGTAHIPVATDDVDVYLTRESPFNADLMRLKKIIGLSMVYNQLLPNQSKTVANIRNTGVSGVYDGRSITLNGTASDWGFDNIRYTSGVKYFPAGHVFYINGLSGKIALEIASNGSPVGLVAPFYNDKIVKIPNYTGATSSWIRLRFYANDVFNNDSISPNVFDLTQMFGEQFADAINTLEQATSGAGIALIKQMLSLQTYSQNDGTIMSSKPISHEMKGYVSGQTNSLATCAYPLSGADLRGMAKLDSQNKLYFDGDEYTPDGSIKRNYGTRAYQSGDESDSSVLTDGTNTVYKLSTPTTEASTPYIELQATFPNGTEEFVDERTIPIPVHQESIYYVNA